MVDLSIVSIVSVVSVVSIVSVLSVVSRESWASAVKLTLERSIAVAGRAVSHSNYSHSSCGQLTLKKSAPPNSRSIRLNAGITALQLRHQLA